MKKLWNRITITVGLLVVAAVVLGLPVGNRKGLVAEAVGTCPITVHQSGSTTVAPITTSMIPDFSASGHAGHEAGSSHWGPGTTVDHSIIGSNGGLQDLDSDVPGALGPITYHADGAQMSRKPVTNSPGGAGREPAGFNERKYNYFWQIANDAFVMAVDNTGSMAFLGTYGLTKTDLATIYGAGAVGGPNGTTPITFPEGQGITHLHWDELPSAISRALRTSDPGHAADGFPHRLIVPEMRSTLGGSRTDYINSVGVPAGQEADTYWGLHGADGDASRHETSQQMAEAVDGINPDHISYTSLSQEPPAVSRTSINVPIAVTDAGPFVIATDGHVTDGTFPLPRTLWIGTHDKATSTRVDNTAQVRIDDLMNFFRSDEGNAFIAADGYPTITPADVPPIPDWDLNLDGSTNVLDLGQIKGRWGASSSCIGWIRPDANNDGKVSLGDVGYEGQHWSVPGFACVVDAHHNCLRDASDPPQ